MSAGAHPGSYNGQDAFNDLLFPDVPQAFRMTAIGEYADDDTGSTLKACDHNEPKDLVVPQAFNWQSGGDARGLNLTDQTSGLTTQQTPAVLMTMREGKPGGGKGPLMVEEESLTLATGNGQTLFQPQAFRKSRRPQSATDAETWVDDGQANTLNVFDVGDTRTTHAIVEPPAYGVRRLTPVECERLQAFPDGWTEPAGSDSARYKALGNAVTVNTVGWILGRVLSVEGITTARTNDAPYGSQVDVAAMLNFQGSKGNSVTNDGEESFALNAMHGHDVHVVAVDVP